MSHLVVFSLYDDFDSVFESYCQENLKVFVEKNATTIECANKTIKNERNLFQAAWRYKFVQLQCKHFGSYASRSSGSRPDTE
ncbi:hypothetical protein RRG08_031592 [Elysia crispata]|uniref:ZSWIM3 N-terminal domain-containing protein n=1 Tax=Elysia crispata TaxID=231223 RepID=A0AAE1B465_9GAST|nr:hypothetical protein RRG08_031592 [Elysia crispata]